MLIAREELLEALRDNQETAEDLLLVNAGSYEHAQSRYINYEPFYAWTKRHVYFVGEYDGMLTVHSVVIKPNKNEQPNYY